MDKSRHHNSSDWQLCPVRLQADDALQKAVIDYHRTVYQDQFTEDSGINHQLPFQLRAFRYLEDWRVMLLLTPWMLARLFIPNQIPDIGIPADWTAESRQNCDYLVIGPSVDFSLLSGKQKAHLNYAKEFGHYLLHPLVLDMTPFNIADQVFEAWNEIIGRRDENLKKMQKENPRQQEISRRELFKGFLRPVHR